jgi:hypothetical protein
VSPFIILFEQIEVAAHRKSVDGFVLGPSNDTNPAVEAYHKVLVWDIVRAPFVTRAADRVLSPLIGKSLVVYLSKPAVAVAGLPDARPSLPRGVPGRRGPSSPKHGAAA